MSIQKAPVVGWFSGRFVTVYSSYAKSTFSLHFARMNLYFQPFTRFYNRSRTQCPTVSNVSSIDPVRARVSSLGDPRLP